jgi:hypothetical protein
VVWAVLLLIGGILSFFAENIKEENFLKTPRGEKGISPRIAKNLPVCHNRQA